MKTIFRKAIPPSSRLHPGNDKKNTIIISLIDKGSKNDIYSKWQTRIIAIQ